MILGERQKESAKASAKKKVTIKKAALLVQESSNRPKGDEKSRKTGKKFTR